MKFKVGDKVKYTVKFSGKIPPDILRRLETTWIVTRTSLMDSPMIAYYYTLETEEGDIDHMYEEDLEFDVQYYRDILLKELGI